MKKFVKLKLTFCKTSSFPRPLPLPSRTCWNARLNKISLTPNFWLSWWTNKKEKHCTRNSKNSACRYEASIRFVLDTNCNLNNRFTRRKRKFCLRPLCAAKNSLKIEFKFLQSVSSILNKALLQSWNTEDKSAIKHCANAAGVFTVLLSTAKVSLRCLGSVKKSSITKCHHFGNIVLMYYQMFSNQLTGTRSSIFFCFLVNWHEN